MRSPATQHTQTIAISASSEIWPWPATRPPTITAVSPGRDEAEERAGLEEREHADGEVGPLAERLAGVLEHLLEVRQLDHADADQHRDRDHDQLGDLEPALLLVAAGDQPAREHRPRPRARCTSCRDGARVAGGVQARDRLRVAR